MRGLGAAGGEYGGRARQSARSRARDRARLRALALLLALIVVGGLVVWLIVRSESDGKDTTASPCASTSGSPAKVTLRVLNATARDGLAASVAADLRGRGYHVSGVGNDSHPVAASAEIRYGSAGAPAARTIAKLISGATSRNDHRAGADIDLVLGNRFTKLAAVPPAAARSSCK